MARDKDNIIGSLVFNEKKQRMLNLFFEGIARSLKTQKLTMLLMRFC
jgi:hypothetical protein